MLGYHAEAGAAVGGGFGRGGLGEELALDFELGGLGGGVGEVVERPFVGGAFPGLFVGELLIVGEVGVVVLPGGRVGWW